MGKQYQPTDKLAVILCDNYKMIQVLSRFGIALGFGDKTVEEVCQKNNVDTYTFLMTLNFVYTGYVTYVSDEDIEALSLSTLVDYLKQSHSYFLDFSIPTIRKQLLVAMDGAETQVEKMIMKFFDEYAESVNKHMRFENEKVFSFVHELIRGNQSSDFDFVIYKEEHEEINESLVELKNLLIKYYPSSASNNILNSVLYDIFRVEEELEDHNKIEDFLFIPAVLRLTKEDNSTKGDNS